MEHRLAQVLILDEAHRTAQLRPVKSRRQAERLRVFTLCHDQNAFPARYRLYQTATPRVYDASNARVARIDRTKWIVASMSDESIFGPVAYRLPYKEAAEKGFLSDYRIIAIGVDERAWTAANRIVQRFEQSHESRGLTTNEALSWLVYGVTLAGGAAGVDGSVRVSQSLAFLNKVQRSDQMVQIYVPLEDEQPVRQAVVVNDGPVTRVGVWTGPRGHAESAVNQAKVPEWHEASASVTEYLTPDKGFQWREQPMSPGTPARFTDGPPGDDERTLKESPAVLVLQRRRSGVTCTVQEAARSMERQGGVDVAKTLERARERAEQHEPLPRRPRRRPSRRDGAEQQRPPGLSPTQRLLEQIRQDGVGRDVRVEVMEKSGLRGNDVRDFNLLMEPVRRASDHLRHEGLEGRLRSVLGMEHLQDTDAHADACMVSVLLLMNAALLHARLEDTTGPAADLARVGRLHDVATGAEPVRVLREAWTTVLRYDYEPVFRPALSLLAPPTPCVRNPRFYMIANTLQHKLGSANESGTQNRATANGAKSRQRSIATRLSWAQRCEREGWRHRESRQGSGARFSTP